MENEPNLRPVPSFATEDSEHATRPFHFRHYADPVDELAGLIVKLTYGKMNELAAGIGADAQKIWDWATERDKNEGKS
jgi:hypothetical protein